MPWVSQKFVKITCLILTVNVFILVLTDVISAQNVNIPDLGLREVIELTLGKEPGDDITQNEMESIESLQASRCDFLTLSDMGFWWRPERWVCQSVDDVSGYEIQDLTGLEYSTNLTHLYLDNNQISDLSPIKDLANLTHLSLGRNQISDISPLKDLTNLTHLSLGRNQISDISPLQDLTNLTHLFVLYNRVSDISSLKNLTGLIELEFEGNQISDISSLKDLTNLTHLSIRKNKLSDISPLQDLTMLTYLSLRENKIANVTPLKDLTKLTYLHIAFNYTISDVSPLEKLTNLIHLQLDHNIISDVTPLKDMTNLRHLDASDNYISDLHPLKNLSKLTWIDLDTNKNLDLSALKYFPNLTFLDIHDNEISDLSFLTVLPKLRRLDLDDNNITDISPLAILTNLTELDLSGNKISDVTPLRNLTNLRVLDLRRNQIANFTPLTNIIDNLTIYHTSNQSVPLIITEDVNRDGVVDIVDLILVAVYYRTPDLLLASRYGAFPDVNNDGVVDINDIIAVAAAIDAALAAPTLMKYPVETSQLTIENLKLWIRLAGQLESQEHLDQEGIAVLKQLLEVLLQKDVLPNKTALLPNFPNPFNPETWIPYQLAEPGVVTISIHSIDGKHVRKLSLGHLSAGIYHQKSQAAYWDGRNELGEFVANGVYFYTLKVGNFETTKKMIIHK